MTQTDIILANLAEHFRKRLKHARLQRDWKLIEMLEIECSEAKSKILNKETPDAD